MMKKTVLSRLPATVALTVALTLSSVAGAASAFAAEFKVAVVDLQKVLHTTNAGKAAQKKFDDLRDKKKASLEKQDKSLQRRQKELGQAQGELEKAAAELQGKAPPDELKKKANEFQEQARKFQSDLMDFEKAQRSAADELAKKEGDLLKPIEDIIKQKVEAIAKEQNISLVISRQVAVYVTSALDITPEVIKRCDGQ